MSNNTPFTPSRRAVLGLMGGSITALTLAGCKVQTQSSGGGPSTNTKGIVIPDPKVKLPTGKVTFRWMDTGDRKALFEKPVFKAYHAKHNNITIDYSENPWKSLNQVVPLGIRNQTAPDVFAKPNNIPATTMVKEGWVQPIEDVIPDFATWRKAFPSGILVPGIHIFNNKVYTFPLTSSGQLYQMLWYDQKILQSSGIDSPKTNLTSWDQFRAAAKKVTQQGKGKKYGIIVDKGLYDFVRGFAQSAGWNTLGGIDPKTGRYTYAAQPVLDAIGLALAMKSDGSIFPGSGALTMKAEGERFPQGVAGMSIQGPWHYQQWQLDSPDWEFGVLPIPTPDGSGTYYRTYSQGGGNDTWVYAKSKYPEIAADIYSYTGSLAGQTQLVIASEGSLSPTVPGALENAKKSGATLNPVATEILDLSKAHCRIGPVPAVRNQDVDQVKLELKPVKPAFDDILEGLFSGQVKDYKAALNKLDSESDKALDQAIAAAKKKGANVSRSDYVFPNFDLSKDYTQADYDAL